MCNTSTRKDAINDNNCFVLLVQTDVHVKVTRSFKFKFRLSAIIIYLSELIVKHRDWIPVSNM